MCYKIELQKKNEEKLKKKLDEVNIPSYMRRFFLVTIESKAGALNYLGIIKDLLNYFLQENIIRRDSIASIQLEDFSYIMAEDITMYLKKKEKEGMSLTTLETRKNVIRSFWNYISRVNGSDIKDDFFKDVRYKGISSANNNLIKKFPSDEQISNMENKISQKPDMFLRKRNMAIFYLLKGSGIRESELVGLDINDLFLYEEVPYVKVIGKGVYRTLEARTVYLTGRAREHLIDWLNEREKIDKVSELEAVFITKKLKRMTENEIIKMFSRASNGSVTPHMFRHYFATIAANELGIVFAQQNLGHKSVKTTVSNYANGIYGIKDTLAKM